MHCCRKLEALEKTREHVQHSDVVLGLSVGIPDTTSALKAQNEAFNHFHEPKDVISGLFRFFRLSQDDYFFVISLIPGYFGLRLNPTIPNNLDPQ